MAHPKVAALPQADSDWFRAVLGSMSEAVIATDPEGKIRFMNGAAEALTGRRERDAFGLPVSEICRTTGKSSRHAAACAVEHALRSATSTACAPFVLASGTGASRRFDASAAPIRDPLGDCAGAVLVLRPAATHEDIEADRLLASIVESSEDAIYAKSLDGRILSWNAGAEQIYGYTAEEAVGRNVSMLIPPNARNEVPEMLGRISRGERIAHYETVRMRKDGSRVDVSISLSPLSDECGRIMGASSLARDISERKRAAEALQRYAEELDRSNRELEQFAYVASHDMQEPLRTITGYLQLLRSRYKGQIDEKADKYIGFAVEGAERMSALIRDLLSYSRVNTRGGQLRPTSSEASLKSAIQSLRLAIECSGAVITHDPLPVVMADATQLAQLFQNLLGNAIKYRSPERDPRIHISAGREDGFWRFDVEDNGIGFDQQYESKMFLIFQRLHSRGKYPGTGIGLAICKRIVDRHGGQIRALGNPGEGARFSFTIPFQEGP